MFEWFNEFVYVPFSSLTFEQFRSVIIIAFIVKLFDLIVHFGNMCFYKAIEIRNRNK